MWVWLRVRERAFGASSKYMLSGHLLDHLGFPAVTILALIGLAWPQTPKPKPETRNPKPETRLQGAGFWL